MKEFHETAVPEFEMILKNTKEPFSLCSMRDFLLPKLITGEVAV
jgi:hypothetical protein